MRVTLFAVLCIAFLLAGCTADRFSIGPVEMPRFAVTGVTESGTLADGETGTFTVNFQGNSGPFTFVYTFTGGGTDPETVTQTAPNGSTSTSVSVTFIGSDSADTEIHLVVNGTDANGAVATVSGSFTIPKSAPANAAPTLTASSAGDGLVDVTVDDPEGDDVTVKLDTLDDGSGIDVTPGPAKLVKGGHGTVQLTATPNNVLAPDSGKIHVLAGDANGGITEITITMQAQFHWMLADALYAIPLQNTVHVGEPVTIEVLTTATANPFRAAVVRLTVAAASGYHFEAGSFNVGIPGGAADDPDGVWNAVQPSGFFDSWDGIGFQQLIDFGPLLTGTDFRVVPFGGQDVPAADGAIFNFAATFATPGTWKLGFQQFNVVDRTYYQDGSQGADYFWSDISNDHPGIPNSVTVLP
jgi:hypothetical protein